MATTFPAIDLNTKRWAKAKAEQFAPMLRTNTALLILVPILILCLCAAIWQIHYTAHVIETFKPIVIRINDVGKAEVVYYRDVTYRPETPEVQRDLSEFVIKFHTRRAARLQDYFQSKYYLSQALGLQSYQSDQYTQWVKDLLDGKLPENDVTVRKVAIINLATPPYLATVDYTKTFYAAGAQSQTSTKDFTDTIRFVTADKVEGKQLQYNPLGLIITDMQTSEAFR